MKRAEKFQVLAGLLARLCGNFRRSQKKSLQYDCTVNDFQETSWLVVLLVLALLKALTSPVQLVQGLIKCVQKRHLFCKSGLYTPQLFWGVKAVGLSLLLNGRPTQCYICKGKKIISEFYSNSLDENRELMRLMYLHFKPNTVFWCLLKKSAKKLRPKKAHKLKEVSIWWVSRYQFFSHSQFCCLKTREKRGRCRGCAAFIGNRRDEVRWSYEATKKITIRLR